MSGPEGFGHGGCRYKYECFLRLLEFWTESRMVLVLMIQPLSGSTRENLPPARLETHRTTQTPSQSEWQAPETTPAVHSTYVSSAQHARYVLSSPRRPWYRTCPLELSGLRRTYSIVPFSCYSMRPIALARFLLLHGFPVPHRPHEFCCDTGSGSGFLC